MLKRGQVTIFIILGIIIIVAIVFGISMRKQIAKAVTGTETSEALSFTEQSQEVKGHVEDCLRESFIEARRLANAQGVHGEDYITAIETMIKSNMPSCIDIGQFDQLTIRMGDITDVQVELNSKRTEIFAVAKLDVNIEKGEERSSFSEFSTSLDLAARV